MAAKQKIAKVQFLLDTDTCIYLLNNITPVKQKISRAGMESLAISIITLAELFFGACHSQEKANNLQRVKEFVSPPSPRILPITHAIVERFGEIKADLVKRGQIIGDFDILIASTALVNGCTIVTNNQNHYRRIKGLQLENWLD